MNIVENLEEDSSESKMQLYNERNLNRHEINLMNYDLEEKQYFEDNNTTADLYNLSIESQLTTTTTTQNAQLNNLPSRLISLPLYVVYYILEFMVIIFEIFFEL